MVPANRQLAERRLSEGLDVFYFPNFITNEEEEYLIRKINDSPQPQWKQLTSRRLQIWGGDITAKGNLLARPLPPFITKHPDIIARIKATGAFENAPHNGPNHVIMNEYLPGQGIMPHEDGPLYHPVVATLSLGSHTVFHYYQYRADADGDAASNGYGKTIDNRPALSVILEPCSLIISSGAMYTSHLHGIEGVTEDVLACAPHFAGQAIANLAQLEDPQIKKLIGTGTPLQRGVRYSLTCRDVGRVLHLSPRR